MAMTQVAVIIPTIAGREGFLADAVDAYQQTTPMARLYVEHGHPTCGEGWNAGAAKALREGCDVLHFSADDLIPQQGWLGRMVSAYIDAGVFPGAVLLNSDGSVWNSHERPGDLLTFPRVPIMSAETWGRLGPVPPVHYYSDIWLGRKGTPTVVLSEYRFVHLWAQPGRVHDSEPDRLLYERWLANERQQ